MLDDCNKFLLGDGAVRVGVKLGEQFLSFAQVPRGPEHLIHGADHSETRRSILGSDSERNKFLKVSGVGCQTCAGKNKLTQSLLELPSELTRQSLSYE